ncbi:MAG: DoxX family protein [Candidatus Colwellbacteria bacterium]|nr:DoxX family protein [Candidatus Colwellbacteria bacterium]
MVPYLFIWSGVALLLLRVFYGVLFVIHGWPKVKDFAQNAKNFEMMGFRPGLFWGSIVALLEFLGGIAIIIGLYTQVFGLLLAVQMAVAAIWRIRNKHKFAGGYELDIALILIGLILATMGGGSFALDTRLQFLGS